jgi:hypothetical protein
MGPSNKPMIKSANPDAKQPARRNFPQFVSGG